jgi:hypothetical protein
MPVAMKDLRLGSGTLGPAAHPNFFDLAESRLQNSGRLGGHRHATLPPCLPLSGLQSILSQCLYLYFHSSSSTGTIAAGA